MLALVEDALGLAYSLPGTAFKDRFVVKTLSIAVGATLASLFGGIVAGHVNAVLLPAVAAFVYVFAVSPLSDIVDIKGDRRALRRTIPIIVGPRRTVMLSILMAEIPVASTILFSSYLGYSNLTPLSISAVGLAAFAILYPLLHCYGDAKRVNGSYKKMFALHFLLQGSFVLGAI
jgi:4-hydroxybenzoate polyprenyltransferase